MTRRLSQQDMEYVLTRLNMITHGWAEYFKYAVAKRVFAMVDAFHLVESRAHDALAARLEPRRRRTAADHSLRDVAADHGGRHQVAEDRGHPGHPIPRQQDPQPMDTTSLTADAVESPLR